MTVEQALEQLKAAIIEGHDAAQTYDQLCVALTAAHKRSEKAAYELRLAELRFRGVVSGVDVPELLAEREKGQ